MGYSSSAASLPGVSHLRAAVPPGCHWPNVLPMATVPQRYVLCHGVPPPKSVSLPVLPTSPSTCLLCFSKTISHFSACVPFFWLYSLPFLCLFMSPVPGSYHLSLSMFEQRCNMLFQLVGSYFHELQRHLWLAQGSPWPPLTKITSTTGCILYSLHSPHLEEAFKLHLLIVLLAQATLYVCAWPWTSLSWTL